MRFFPSIHRLMCLSLEALASIIRTGKSVLVELIDMVNYVIIRSNDLTKMVMTLTLTVLLFWIY